MSQLRKKPVQKRSLKRFEAILDAAAILFAERGVDGTTMEAIAQGASTSIGSVYQYFPDKKSVFMALAERLLERTNSISQTVFEGAPGQNRHWKELIDHAVDAGVHMLQWPDARAVWRHIQVYGEVAAADIELHETLILKTKQVLRCYAPNLDQTTIQNIATMTIDIIGSVFFIATLRDKERATAQLIELRTVLQRYLEPYVEVERPTTPVTINNDPST